MVTTARQSRKLGLLAFANDGGLGAQTRRLAQFLKPERIMVIDSSGFSRNRTQHFEWYKDFTYFIVSGFPNNTQVKKFLENLTHVFCVENPYNFGLVYWGQQQGTKIYCQSNYEFCENLAQPWLPVPDKFLMPSYWKVEEMQERFGKDRVEYLPPPIDPHELEKAREFNFKRQGKRRFLHVIGTAAHMDRNGTLDLIDAVKKTKADFELVIRSQHPLSMDVFLDDPRVRYEVNNLGENSELYVDFDALILPRRWGGLSLTVNEALMAGLPVIMTRIEPNKNWLPGQWLVESQNKDTFYGRSAIDVYSAIPELLAKLIDDFATMSDGMMQQQKKTAFSLAVQQFSFEVLRKPYSLLFDDGKS